MISVWLMFWASRMSHLKSEPKPVNPQQARIEKYTIVGHSVEAAQLAPQGRCVAAPCDGASAQCPALLWANVDVVIAVSGAVSGARPGRHLRICLRLRLRLRLRSTFASALSLSAWASDLQTAHPPAPPSGEQGGHHRHLGRKTPPRFGRAEQPRTCQPSAGVLEILSRRDKPQEAVQV